MIEREIGIKNLICSCCATSIKKRLHENGIEVTRFTQAGIAVIYNESIVSQQKINDLIKESGYDVILHKDEIIVEKIKKHIIDLVYHMNNNDSIIRKSDYLSEMLDLSYHQLSRIFSKYEPITLEKYIILVKIARIKELLIDNEYSLSEIAYMMDYSSVQHLSMQFKKITGTTVSDYKNQPSHTKVFLNQLY